MTSVANKRSLPLSFLLYGGLAFWLLIASLPIVWTAIISFRQYIDAFSSPLKWVAPFTMENYSRLWIDKEFYRNFLNTALVTVFTVTISLTVGCLAGYALSRYRGSLGFWLLMVALMFRAIPHSSLLPSFFTIFDALGIRNTYFTLIHMMDAYRVFEPVIVLTQGAFTTSVQYLTYHILLEQNNPFKASAAAVLTLIGIVFLLIPLLVKTWREQKQGV